MGIKKIRRKSRIQRRTLKALIFGEYCRGPLPDTAVMPPPPIFYTRRCAMNPEMHVSLPWHLSDNREYSRHGVPVTKPHIASSFITALEFVIEQPEFSLCWKASAASGRIRGHTVEISDDRPAIAYLHWNRSKKSADLVGVRRAPQYSSTTAIRRRPIAYHYMTILVHP